MIVIWNIWENTGSYNPTFGETSTLSPKYLKMYDLISKRTFGWGWDKCLKIFEILKLHIWNKKKFTQPCYSQTHPLYNKVTLGKDFLPKTGASTGYSGSHLCKYSCGFWCRGPNQQPEYIACSQWRSSVSCFPGHIHTHTHTHNSYWACRRATNYNSSLRAT